MKTLKEVTLELEDVLLKEDKSNLDHDLAVMMMAADTNGHDYLCKLISQFRKAVKNPDIDVENRCKLFSLFAKREAGLIGDEVFLSAVDEYEVAKFRKEIGI
ncbi:hypothetical protein [Bacteroides pyogenes]|uniref:hypothetical protein n=1 Tax=Bacteroides pyogenes TaxID=310300 RepID=UPI002FDB6349